MGDEDPMGDQGRPEDEGKADATDALYDLDEEAREAILKKARGIPLTVVPAPGARGGPQVDEPDKALKQNRPRIGGYADG